MTRQITAPGIGRKGHSAARRIGLIAVGVAVVLAGFVAWGVETEYGSGHGLSIAVIGDHAKVYDTDGDSGTEPVFEGTRAEAEAYTEAQRTSGRNYTIPVLILAAGGALVLFGIRPGRKLGHGAA